MKRKNALRNALFTSILSLLLCVSMLVSTTFAWFTDEVKSGMNVIASGNLDIDLEYWNGTAWTDLQGATDLFSESLWEPGHTQVVYLRMTNNGTLDLKYNLGINIVEETTGTNVYGNEFKLSDYIYMGVAEGVEPKFTTREAAITAAKNGTNGIIGEGYAKPGIMTEKGEELMMAVVVYMPEETDNRANYKTGTTAPSITLGINLFATQLVSENDSFGSDYDKGAAWTGSVDTNWYFEDPTAATFTIESAEELAGLATIVNGTATAPSTTFAMRATPETVQDTFAGKTIKLANDIDLRDISWTPIGRIGKTSTDFTYSFKGTFDGQGHTVSNLAVANEGWAGVFGIAHHATIKNLSVDTVSIQSNRMAGAIVGQIYGSVENCHVANATIMVTPNWVGTQYDNGDKVGGIVGWLGDNGENRTLSNCSATNVQIGAYRDVAAIAGYVASSTVVSGCKVTKATITVDQESNNYGYKEPNAGLVYGRTGGTITDENNTTDEESVVTSTYIVNGLTLKKNGVTGEIKLYLVPETYEGATVTVPEGVTAIGGYAFAYNTNVEKIVLPSTVTTLSDRAFRDTSASTVVLNEGLTNISYQAFRNAANVTTVEIPSTVTTISKEAFQNSGITTLSIPANVTTVEYGACRDMKKLETVVIEGNVEIPVYAFRACTNLKTVTLNGEDVTFGGKGMIFTNKENGDGSAITVFVKNDTVKERLLAADTAAKDYGGYKIIVGAKVVENATDLQTALNDGGYVVLADDVQMKAATTAPYGNKYAVKLDGGVLDGNGNELYMECYGDDYGIMTSGGTIKNLTVKEGCRAVMIMYPQEDVILDNVKLGGDGVLYPINTGEAGAAGVNLVVTNSTLAGWTSYGLIESATFTNVAFEQGTYYNNIYGRVLKPYVNTTLTNCSFVKAMNLDLSALTNGHKIVIENCTVDGVALTADVMVVPTTDAQYNTELFTVDLPSWATSVNDCIVFK